ncbi:uncharacterized protein PITG_01696 [Phytophthora infestans T30-4]|uniref:Uncharacterized protein n=1 Tax=Phytophthora infestans (strain T30-4) TaxID=403677 RepID=D0MTV3_PHYIT|nr:uncharacterized protein PITG_01696 [Phytophthora infestans T30-4]EEY61400.1 conserved hypothetical protein [Phytophthora infestans T30-4]|eukprot:XP_002908317.1 conserved hypothetical protein [Phytophthora infestans T30-4]
MAFYYVHFYYPGVRLTRAAEDVCDCCIFGKTTHINEAIAQRRFVSKFIKSYTALHAPDQQLPDDIIPDTYDTCDDDTIVFGGGISMPHYGHSRPSSDYFNSNLIIQKEPMPFAA